MTINPCVFKGYDIRGLYPQELNEQNLVPIISAIYKKLAPRTIVVGTDMRTSSPSLTKVAIETLVALGAHVIDIGVVSTPTFYFAVSHYKYDAGVQITASHNPKEWNGIKIVKNSPTGLIKIGKSTGLEDIKQMAISGQSVSFQAGGLVIQKSGVLEDEVENALRITGNSKLNAFKIVADAANAMGSQYIDALFKKIPGELFRMNFTLDGTFPVHQPDPLQKINLVDLQEEVISQKADLGLAPDGDGDRLFFIDEKGNVVPPTIITSIVAKKMLIRNPKAQILVDIRYLLTPKKIIEENGGKMVVTKVGHAYITETMHKTNAIFAGESSAHYYFRETGNAEAPMPIILFVLQVLSEEKKPLSAIVEEYRRSFESGEINLTLSNAEEILEEVKKKYKDGLLNTMDGVAISFNDWRFSLRLSNTEPLMRLNVEAYEKEIMEQKRDELILFIKSMVS